MMFTPICPVEGGKMLITANKLVFNIDEMAAKRMRPYLFQAPRDFSDYDEVLRTLGAERQITFDQLAGVLSSISRSCDDKRMHPNERQTAWSTLKCMFSLMKESEGKCPISVKDLFLPTSEDKLKRSTDLYYADVHQMNRIALASSSLEFVVPLKQCDIEVEHSESHHMNLLPPNLRPHNLQDKTQEKPCETNEICPGESDCPFLLHFKRIITSEEMQRVLLRLVQHQNQNKEPSDNQREKIQRLLDFDNFQCVIKLKTGLYNNEGTLLVERKGSRNVFLEKINQNGVNFKLLLEHQNQQHISRMLLLPLARKIDIICSLGLDAEHLSYLHDIIDCKSVDSMNSVLKHFEIPEYDTIDNEHQPDPAKPGTIVPEDIRHLLDDDPYNLFQPDEIVVFKSPVEDTDSQTDDIDVAASNIDSGMVEHIDDYGEEEYSFVYAKIIEEVTNEGISHLNRKYRIDLC